MKILKKMTVFVLVFVLATSATIVPVSAEEALFSSKDMTAEMSLEEEAIVRPYWQGEPMEFVWATFAPLNELQLFTLPDQDDAGGFIYGMWIKPGFVLFRHSEDDVMHHPGWSVDWEAVDERILPMLNQNDERRLTREYPDLYAELAGADGTISMLLSAICEDLDDVWWFRKNLVPGEREPFKRPGAMIRGLVSDILALEERIGEELRKRDQVYDSALAALRSEPILMPEPAEEDELLEEDLFDSIDEILIEEDTSDWGETEPFELFTDGEAADESELFVETEPVLVAGDEFVDEIIFVSE